MSWRGAELKFSARMLHANGRQELVRSYGQCVLFYRNHGSLSLKKPDICMITGFWLQCLSVKPHEHRSVPEIPLLFPQAEGNRAFR